MITDINMETQTTKIDKINKALKIYDFRNKWLICERCGSKDVRVVPSQNKIRKCRICGFEMPSIPEETNENKTK